MMLHVRKSSLHFMGMCVSYKSASHKLVGRPARNSFLLVHGRHSCRLEAGAAGPEAQCPSLSDEVG